MQGSTWPWAEHSDDDDDDDNSVPSNFATRAIAKNLRTQENCEELVSKSN